MNFRRARQDFGDHVSGKILRLIHKGYTYGVSFSKPQSSELLTSTKTLYPSWESWETWYS